MATLVSDPVRFIADQWENHCGYASAVLSGIVPDSRHLDDGGYHCSVEDLRKYGNAGDYSNTRPDDRDKNVRYGAAIDMSMSPADMKKCHDRMRKVWADPTDPRRKFINCFNTWDGSGDAVRLDFVTGTAGYASPDHKWHDHGEVRRRYLLDMIAARGYVSALKGESKAAYLASTGQGEDDIPVDAKAFAALLRNPEVGDILFDAIWRRDRLNNPYGDKATNPTIYPQTAMMNIGAMTESTKVVVGSMATEIAGLRSVVEALAATIKAGGGSVETTAILAGVDRAVTAVVATLTAETRDAVADLGEGGAAQVRADK